MKKWKTGSKLFTKLFLAALVAVSIGMIIDVYASTASAQAPNISKERQKLFSERAKKLLEISKRDFKKPRRQSKCYAKDSITFEVVNKDGDTLGCTHGYDPDTSILYEENVSQDSGQAMAAAAVNNSRPYYDDVRPIWCEGDGQSGYRYQAVYAYENPTQNFGEVHNKINYEVEKLMSHFYESGVQSGRPAVPRFSMNSDCSLNIMHWQVSAAMQNGDFSEFMSAAEQAGFANPARKYLFFNESTDPQAAGNRCGIAWLFYDLTKSPQNWNNTTSHMSVTCWGYPGQHTTTHEVLHSLGAVIPGTPGHTPGNHCVDDYDILCYRDHDSVTMTYPCGISQEDRIDCNKDTYFNTIPPAGSWLANNWNTVDNRFMTWSDVGGPAGRWANILQTPITIEKYDAANGKPITSNIPGVSDVDICVNNISNVDVPSKLPVVCSNTNRLSHNVPSGPPYNIAVCGLNRSPYNGWSVKEFWYNGKNNGALCSGNTPITQVGAPVNIKVVYQNSTPLPTTVRIDSGSATSSTDPKGNTWLADQFYIDGQVTDSGNIPITGSSHARIHQSERWGTSGYEIPIKNGTYDVILHYIENYAPINAAGLRPQRATVEGVATPDIDVFKETGRRGQPVTRTVRVNVTDSRVNIAMTALGTNANAIAGIEVLPAGTAPTAPPTVHRIDAASDLFTNDAAGNRWIRDNFFSTGNVANNGNIPIAGTSNPFVYQTERWAGGAMSYTIPVHNGIYDVVMHHVENAGYVAGGRIFAVTIEGTNTPDTDIFKEAGGKGKAISKVTRVTVTDGTVNIDFRRIAGEPSVAGIEVLPAGTLPTPPPPPPPTTGKIQMRKMINGSVATASTYTSTSACLRNKSNVQIGCNGTAAPYSSDYTWTVETTDNPYKISGLQVPTGMRISHAELYDAGGSKTTVTPTLTTNGYEITNINPTADKTRVVDIIYAYAYVSVKVERVDETGALISTNNTEYASVLDSDICIRNASGATLFCSGPAPYPPSITWAQINGDPAIQPLTVFGGKAPAGKQMSLATVNGSNVSFSTTANGYEIGNLRPTGGTTTVVRMQYTTIPGSIEVQRVDTNGTLLPNAQTNVCLKNKSGSSLGCAGTSAPYSNPYKWNVSTAAAAKPYKLYGAAADSGKSISSITVNGQAVAIKNTNETGGGIEVNDLNPAANQTLSVVIKYTNTVTPTPPPPTPPPPPPDTKPGIHIRLLDEGTGQALTVRDTSPIGICARNNLGETVHCSPFNTTLSNPYIIEKLPAANGYSLYGVRPPANMRLTKAKIGTTELSTSTINGLTTISGLNLGINQELVVDLYFAGN